LAKAETIVPMNIAVSQPNVIFRTNTGYMFRLTCLDVIRLDNV